METSEKNSAPVANNNNNSNNQTNEKIIDNNKKIQSLTPNPDNMTPSGDDNINNNQKNSNNTNNFSTPMGNEQELNKSIEEEQSFESDNNNDDLSLTPSFSFNNTKKAPLVILEDTKNTTYMSNVIRCLTNIKPIAKYYSTNLNNIKSNLNIIPLSYAFSRIIYNLYSFPEDSLKKSFSLSNFHKITTYINPFFKGNDLKNSIDFLIFLSESLHQEDITLKKENNNKEKIQKNEKDLTEYLKNLSKKENSIIFNNFAWIAQKIKKCLECNEEFITYLNFFTFDLNIDKILTKSQTKLISVYDCIKLNSAKEKKECPLCPSCKKNKKFEVESSIRVAPNYFIFLLRLDHREIIQKYLNGGYKIKIEESIDLSDLIKESNSKSNYYLNGIIFIKYILNDIEYISIFRNPFDENWYKYENNDIAKINIDCFLNPENKNNLYPVILFYNSNLEVKINN